MYEVGITKYAYKQISKLPKVASDRITAALDRAKIRPQQHFERLVGEKLFKLRVGDYRIIADIIKGELVVLVVKVDHRKRIYRR